MGLDMYLSARRYTSEFSDKEANDKLSSIADDLLPPDGNFGAIVISRDVAYWRKANQIHAWFVAKVQDGKDDCGTYDVAREQLEELRDTCLKVLGGISLVDGTVNNGWTYTNGVREAIKEPGKVIANPELAKQLLPPQEGFFFGSTDYDQWYAEDLKSTVEQIDKVLAWVDADLLASGAKYSPSTSNITQAGRSERMTITTVELLACPFCEGPVHNLTMGGVAGCSHIGEPHCPVASHRMMTVEQWNTRTEPTLISNLVKALKLARRYVERDAMQGTDKQIAQGLADLRTIDTALRSNLDKEEGS